MKHLHYVNHNYGFVTLPKYKTRRLPPEIKVIFSYKDIINVTVIQILLYRNFNLLFLVTRKVPVKERNH